LVVESRSSLTIFSMLATSASSSARQGFFYRW
jgi:hypothetical protein